jgi:hypothetical protein
MINHDWQLLNCLLGNGERELSLIFLSKTIMRIIFNIDNEKVHTKAKIGASENCIKFVSPFSGPFHDEVCVANLLH